MPRFFCIRRVVFCAGFAWLSAAAVPGTAATFFVDPVNGSPAGDGSAANPWQTLQGVFDHNRIESQEPAVFPYNGLLATRNFGAPVKAGDTLKLLTGYHGDIVERGYFNTGNITIEAAAGHTPTLKGFHMQGAKNWTLRGLSVSPEFAGVVDTGSIVRFETHNWYGPASDITIEDSTIFSTADSSAWTAADWNAKAAHGIQVSGPAAGSANFVLRNNDIRNVDFGINTGGNDILAEGNAIENFAGDGMRGGGDRVTFAYNTIKTSFDVSSNHDDGIQFFRGFGVPNREVVLRGNRIETFADPARPLTHGAQGIGNFDGPNIDWVVENNVVMTAHHHGITVLDADNVRVVNNTVLDTSGAFDSWISLEGSTNSTIRNNLTTKFSNAGANNLTLDHNLLLSAGNLDSIFVDRANGDLRLKAGASAIDAGVGTLAPVTDIDLQPRPSGAGFDLGAYEFSAALAGDYNNSGLVEQGDLDLVLLNWGTAGTPAGWVNEVPVGIVDQAELDGVLLNWGNSSEPGVSGGGSAVPEPGTAVLLALGGLVVLRRGAAR